jgi:hypothetical protein
MNMARKDGPGLYQIGIYTVMREGSGWVAFSHSALGEYRKHFHSLGAAHLELTGESIR